ncbi:helix-turn-helix domain-containing protein [Catenuloplanes sp. NPDC051500]|uniref:helix-turn-helix domain-containing protein n=1 Tax=Catenuloplanes sp. NPDC051500 TaxID=3363959 RepID=UPI0037A1EFE4
MAGEVIHEHLNHTERFAAYLRMLKSRSGFGFNQLGKLAGVSSSSLHRYCSGASVPQDYRIVLSFARSCGATTEEIRQLHRLWAAAEAVRHTEAMEVVADGPEPDEPFEADDIDVPEPEIVPAAPRRRGRYLVLAAAGVIVVLAAAGLLALRASDEPGNPGPADDRLLFSRACQDPVSMGQHDECVREVQDLLIKAGGRLAVDGEFGPETLRRVTAFQVLAGLPARGVVDDVTKTALYDQKARLTTWPAEQVESRIREVFAEDPDHAVAIARCQSRLDPLHITPNTNGTRNWGLYQLTDSTLASLGGSPAQAFDPEWNITAAHQLWGATRDFRQWPFCEAALNATPVPSTSAG